MKSIKRQATNPNKASTGIEGFDEITNGGLPHGRTTLLVGQPGSGKTIFGLRFLVHGAQVCKEPGIFVAFEEASRRIVANAEGFGWNLPELLRKKLYIVDAQPQPDLVQTGDFDLSGLLTALEAKAKEIGARRIVFDAIDIMLALLPDATAKRREMYRLHAWLLEREMTAIITAKAGGDEASSLTEHPFSFMQFMVDCSVALNHSVTLGVSQRNLRVQKYRGSAFDENEAPFVIGKGGFDVAIARALGREDSAVSDERVSSGVARLDTMLGGGYYRGASILITGVTDARLNRASRQASRASMVTGLTRKSSAPSSMTRRGVASSGFPVISTICTDLSSASFLRSRSSVVPSPPGILMSLKIKSGICC